MEGRVQLRCAECGKTKEIAGEIPKEYIDRFAAAVQEEGWVPRPGAELKIICGRCLRRYEGHESVDDAKKIRKM
ncbi:MAG TPA: hypothetical protein VMS98_13910 [Thermoanaerobaculia bacterium]|nr:hypothetical protein [Thermoanaerobaculia bacterium]